MNEKTVHNGSGNTFNELHSIKIVQMLTIIQFSRGKRNKQGLKIVKFHYAWDSGINYIHNGEVKQPKGGWKQY